jgi:hypothetical protein
MQGEYNSAGLVHDSTGRAPRVYTASRMQGTLDTFSVVEILQVLGSAKHSGTLHIECSDRQVDVRFVSGHIAETRDSTRVPADTTLGSQLLRRSLITEPQLSEALAEQETNPCPLGTLLVARGFLTEADLRDVLSRQIARTLVGAKASGEGTFVFVADAESKPAQCITIETYQVLMEISSVAGDYLLALEALGQSGTVLIRNRDYESLPRYSMAMGRDEFYLLSLVDDHRTVGQIAAASRLEEVTTVSILGKFAESGVLLAKSQGQPDDADSITARRDMVWAEISQLLDDFGGPTQMGTGTGQGQGEPAADEPDSWDELTGE